MDLNCFNPLVESKENKLTKPKSLMLLIPITRTMKCFSVSHMCFNKRVQPNLLLLFLVRKYYISYFSAKLWMTFVFFTKMVSAPIIKFHVTDDIWYN